MGLRHRFLFRDDAERWVQVDNMRRLVRIFATPALRDPEGLASYSVEYGQKCGVPREHRLPVVAALTLANGAQQSLCLPGSRTTLRKLHAVFPLTPGVLLWLQEDNMNVCRSIWQHWSKCALSELDAREMLHVECFVPELASELPRVRLVLQMSGQLMHGSRAVHVQKGTQASECCVRLDDDFVSFRAHDGRNEMLFSTECQSFMRMLDQALVSQEIDADYQQRSGLERAADNMRVWLGGGSANVLADYVFACSVHAVQDVAQMCWLDLVVAEDSDDDTEASILYEMRLFDFELLDTKMAYTSLDEEPDPAQRNNRIGCQSLINDMYEQHLSMLEDEDLRRRQLRRRNGDMESDDEADDGAQDDEPQTPGVHYSDDEEGGAPTQVYSPAASSASP